MSCSCETLFFVSIVKRKICTPVYCVTTMMGDLKGRSPFHRSNDCSLSVQAAQLCRQGKGQTCMLCSWELDTSRTRHRQRSSALSMRYNPTRSRFFHADVPFPSSQCLSTTNVRTQRTLHLD